MVIKSVTSTTYSRHLAPLTRNKRRGMEVSCFPAITIGLRDTTHFASEDDYRTGCPTSVTVNNSPIQDYTHSDDHVCFSFFNFVLSVCFLADFSTFCLFFFDLFCYFFFFLTSTSRTVLPINSSYFTNINKMLQFFRRRGIRV